MQLNYSEIGKNIRLHRVKKQLKQWELADRVHVSAQHISHIECGTAQVGLPLLVDLANELDTSVDTLLGANQLSGRHRILLVQLAAIMEEAPDSLVETCLAVCRVLVERQDQP